MNADPEVSRNTKVTLHLVNRVWLLMVLVLFLVCILIPSYSSGLYRFTDVEIWSKSFDVPFYSGRFGSFLRPLGFFFVLGICYLLPVALVIMAGRLMSPRVDPGSSRRGPQIFIILATLATIAATWRISQALITWIAG